MEDPSRKHDNKKKNRKSMPPVGINIGIGGIVLLGGALLTATLIGSLLALKTTRRTRRRQQQLEKINKTADTPNQLELDQHFSLHSNSSDGVTTMKEMQTTNIQTSTDLEEEHNSGSDNDEQVESGDSMFSLIGEDEENTLIYVDSVFESRQVDDNRCEKIELLECEEQVVMATPPSSEDDSCSVERDGDEEEEEKYCNEKNEEVTWIEEDYELAVEVVEHEVPLGDDVAEEEDACMNEETVFMNEAAEMEMEMEGGCVNVEDKPHPQVQFVEIISDKNEGEYLIADEIMRQEKQQKQNDGEQVLMRELDEEAAYVDLVNLEMNEVGDTFSTHVQVMNEEEKDKETASSEVEEHDVTCEDDEMMNKKEKEIPPHVQVIEADKSVVVVEREENSPRELMNKQEMITEDEIPLVQQPIEEEEEDVSDELQEEEVTDHKNNGSSKRNASTVGTWKLVKLGTWSVLVSSVCCCIWCVYRWYSGLPYTQLSSIIATFIIFIMLLGYQINRTTTYLLKYD